MRLVAALALSFGLALGCAGAGQGIGTRVNTVATTPSGKTLAIYRAASFETEAREVPAEVVTQGLRASSVFFEEDIRALVPEIVPALAKLEDDQRIVIESSDTVTHVFVSASTSELQIISFRSGQEISRHASAIPAAAVKTELAATPKAHSQPQPVPQQTVQQPPVQNPPPVVVEAPPVDPPKDPPKAAPKDTKVVTKKQTTKPPAKTPAKQPRLTEAEIRTKLDELERLRAKGLITEPEYQQKRKSLLDQL